MSRKLKAGIAVLIGLTILGAILYRSAPVQDA